MTAPASPYYVLQIKRVIGTLDSSRYPREVATDLVELRFESLDVHKVIQTVLGQDIGKIAQVLPHETN